ncbi:multicopper oxidase domain-containing protein [Jatrophihabitans telluris]|uniref:Multicopper oxidase domain-containing protein n=1 Tax=Jatrophihabitans telluris TaxID=2038343 RepID=A0ABY4QVU8_9ACTN|nr:multicopper oxidase domain-containing protein [Jatrophihabitans telluris]UQX87377.1 multicopper oxidase domain-containing protein [Jatrophihabitans telluris]
MKHVQKPWLRRMALVAAIASTVATVVSVAPVSAATTGNSEGMQCETNSRSTFNLTAADGYISTPDGNSIYMWSYGDATSGFQLPGPTLCVTEGATVTVVLHNSLPEPTSILFPGQSGVLADGKAAQPQYTTDAAPALTSLVQSASANGGSVTYQFTAGTPGTYLYTSGTDVKKQQQMGMFGALVVRPLGSPVNQVNRRTDSAFAPGKEYLFLLSEVDPDVHLAVERNQPIDWSSYRARYFMINGRSMPDTLAPNNASWLPNQPYGALVHVKPWDAANNPLPATIRYLNAGTVNYPFHPHGSDERVIDKDGHPLVGPSGQDLSYLKYDLDVGPGQTLDTLMDWHSEYDVTNKPIPTQLPTITDQLLVGTDTWFSESGYLGTKNPTPTTITNNNECGEYYHIAHSHALQQATNYGATFGGMMTLFRIDPPSGCPTK